MPTHAESSRPHPPVLSWFSSPSRHLSPSKPAVMAKLGPSPRLATCQNRFPHAEAFGFSVARLGSSGPGTLSPEAAMDASR